MNRLLLVLVLSLLCSGEDKLQRAQSTYLNKSVVVKDGGFRRAAERNGRYEAVSPEEYIPKTAVGKTAQVIAVQGKQLPTTVNALGETVSQQQTGEPVFDFVVKFEDGLLALKKETLMTVHGSLWLPEEVAAFEAQEKANQSHSEELVGRTVYATALSDVFKPEATLDDIRSDKGQITAPFLQPLKVTVAKWNPELRRALVKLQFPDGRVALGKLSPDGVERGGDLLLTMPGGLTAAEKAAIQRRGIARGMSEHALHYALGFPKRQNDWGRGGRQLIYDSGMIVYLNDAGRIEDYQFVQQ